MGIWLRRDAIPRKQETTWAEGNPQEAILGTAGLGIAGLIPASLHLHKKGGLAQPENRTASGIAVQPPGQATTTAPSPAPARSTTGRSGTRRQCRPRSRRRRRRAWRRSRSGMDCIRCNYWIASQLSAMQSQRRIAPRAQPSRAPSRPRGTDPSRRIRFEFRLPIEMHSADSIGRPSSAVFAHSRPCSFTVTRN